MTLFPKTINSHDYSQADLIPTVDSDSLMIALEPEAASFFCRTLSAHEYATSTKDPSFATGAKYVVVDAGGKFCTVESTSGKRLECCPLLFRVALRTFWSYLRFENFIWFGLLDDIIIVIVQVIQLQFLRHDAVCLQVALLTSRPMKLLMLWDTFAKYIMQLVEPRGAQQWTVLLNL